MDWDVDCVILVFLSDVYVVVCVTKFSIVSLVWWYYICTQTISVLWLSSCDGKLKSKN